MNFGQAFEQYGELCLEDTRLLGDRLSAAFTFRFNGAVRAGGIGMAGMGLGF